MAKIRKPCTPFQRPYHGAFEKIGINPDSLFSARLHNPQFFKAHQLFKNKIYHIGYYWILLIIHARKGHQPEIFTELLKYRQSRRFQTLKNFSGSGLIFSGAGLHRAQRAIWCFFVVFAGSNFWKVERRNVVDNLSWKTTTRPSDAHLHGSTLIT